ncbi:MAG: FAD-dependent oxidoreductase [Bacteroidia bacterium]
MIAGSGIVGLNAALNLKRKNPSLRVVVAERGALPSGASTKNAGFACFGSITELMDDLTRMPENEVFSLVEKRYRGLQRLRSIIGDNTMELEIRGGYEIFDDEASFLECAEKLDYFNKNIQPVVGKTPLYTIADKEIQSFGFKGVKHMILNTGEGQINSGKMMERLIAIVRAEGVEILNGLDISGFHETSAGVDIETSNGYRFSCRKFLICVNGFAKQLLKEEDVEPARAQVLITKPLENLKFRGTFHYDKGYYYFRNVGNRVLFGGGRNLDFKGENTWEHSLTDLIQNRLDQLLRDMILPDTPYEIDMRWAGTMGVGARKSPIVKPLSNHIFCAVRMGGMGVALGSLTGEEAAEMVMQHSSF